MDETFLREDGDAIEHGIVEARAAQKATFSCLRFSLRDRLVRQIVAAFGAAK